MKRGVKPPPLGTGRAQHASTSSHLCGVEHGSPVLNAVLGLNFYDLSDPLAFSLPASAEKHKCVQK